MEQTRAYRERLVSRPVRRRPSTVGRSASRGVPAPPGPGHVWIDPEGLVLRIDPELGKRLGHAPEALQGQFFFAYLHARDLAPILKQTAEFAYRGRRDATWRFRFRTAEGVWQALEARVASRGEADAMVLILTMTDGVPVEH